MRSSFVILLASSSLVACVSALLARADPAPKVGICHYDADSGRFHLITISRSAFDSHVAHGDALPGDPMPNGYGELGAECTPEPRLIVDGYSSGRYSGRTLSIGFTVYENPDGTYSGDGEYDYVERKWTFSIDDVCIEEAQKNVTVWGIADNGDHAMLSLHDTGTVMKARAGLKATFAELEPFINTQCGTSPLFPATGTGWLLFYSFL